MSELKDILERAERAIGALPLPPDGFERLTRHRESRHRRDRMLAGVVALMVAAGGTLGTQALLRAHHHASQHPVATSPSASLTPVPTPTGLIVQRTIGGGPAQRLGPFWFGLKDDNSCLSVGPLAIGPSWTFQDDGHACVPALGADPIHAGEARGVVHRDGDPGAPTRFNAVYGLVATPAYRVDVSWAGGGVSSVVPVKGRFLLVWSGTGQPLRATAVSASGAQLANVALTPP